MSKAIPYFPSQVNSGYTRNLRERNSEKGGSKGFPVDLCQWTLEEGTTYSPVELFDLLGPSARTCFSDYIKSGRGYEFDLCDDLDPSELLLDTQKLLRFVASGNIPEGQQGSTFHRFFFGSLSKGYSNPIGGPKFTYNVPTFFLRGVLLSCFRSLELEQQKSFAFLVAPHPHIAWIFYEQAVVKSLVSAATTHQYQLCGLPDALQLGPGLHTHPFLFDPDTFDEEKPFAPVGNRIYIPRVALICPMPLPSQVARITSYFSK